MKGLADLPGTASKVEFALSLDLAHAILRPYSIGGERSGRGVLVGTVQKKYGIAQEEAEKQVKDFKKTFSLPFVSFYDPDVAVTGAVPLAKRVAPPFHRCGNSRA